MISNEIVRELEQAFSQFQRTMLDRNTFMAITGDKSTFDFKEWSEGLKQEFIKILRRSTEYYQMYESSIEGTGDETRELFNLVYHDGVHSELYQRRVALERAAAKKQAIILRRKLDA